MTDHPAGQVRREFLFTKSDFERVRKLIHSYAGIALAESKQELVYSRLSRRLRATGSKTFGEYLAILESNNTREWEAFVNSLTTNLTSFFREPHHFPILADYLRQHQGKHPMVLWCAAASTGEEPYSMAMTAVEALGGFNIPVTIIASDLDTQVLETAKAGLYSDDKLSRMNPEQVRKFFVRTPDVPAGHWRVRQELRGMITFRQANLLHANWPVRAPLDVIFCRNVMIYFDKPTQLDILRRFAPLLRTEGLLFAGHSESFHHAEEYFHLRGKTVYELSARLRAGASSKQGGVA